MPESNTDIQSRLLSRLRIATHLLVPMPRIPGTPEWILARTHAGSLLIDAVRKPRTLIWYSRLAPQITAGGLHFDAYDRHLDNLIGEVSAESLREHDCMLSAACVRKDTRIPGDGFFRWARELGFDIARNDLAELEFWQNQIALVIAAYRPRAH
jgi:hypothetical protein